MEYSKQVKMHPHGVAKLVLHSLEEILAINTVASDGGFSIMTDDLYFFLY